MEIAGSTATVERSAAFTEKTFSIGNPVVIMKIMRSKLYSNPIKVLIQEYLCNARDANREAGCDRPIEVYTPSKFNQSFEVRDYGIGISPERMENVFIRYGESTKRGNNLQTGGFGIGAKSGWSYSDSFSITTVTKEEDHHVKRFYSAIIDETEKGSLIKIGEDEIVDEPTGTRIIVPIKEKDVNLFQSYARQTTCFWKEEVVIFGENTRCKYDYSVVKYRGDLWALHPKTDSASILGEYSNHYRCLAVVDGIQYDIKPDAISDCEEMKKASLLNDIFNNRFLLFFKTGDLNISANREELYYDDKTKAAIIARLKLIELEFLGVVSDQLNAAPDYLSLIDMWNDFIGKNLTLNDKSQSNFLSAFEWKGTKTKIVTAITVDNEFPLSIREYYYHHGRRMSRTTSKIYLNAQVGVKIYENDEGTHLAHRQRIMTLSEKHGKETFVVIGYGDAVTKEKMWDRRRSSSKNHELYTPETFKEDVDACRAFFNFDLFNFTKISTIEKKKVPSRASGLPRSTRASFRRTKKVTWRGALSVDSYDMDIHEETGYYIPTLNCNTLVFNGSQVDVDNSLVRNLMSYFKGKVDLFFVPQKTIDKAKAHKKGIKLIPFENKILEELNDNPDMVKKTLLMNRIDTQNVLDDVAKDIRHHHLNKNIKKIEDIEAAELIRWSYAINDTPDTKSFNYLLEHSPKFSKEASTLYEPYVSEQIKYLEELVGEFTEKYPLLSNINNNYYSVSTLTNAVVDYINAIHRMKNNSCLAAAI